MGLLSYDLERLRSAMLISPKTASTNSPMEELRSALELYSGASAALEKSAGMEEHGRLWRLHGNVESAYRKTAKVGKRPEADALLDKFSGWAYLKGQPSEPGDMKPLPGPDKA